MKLPSPLILIFTGPSWRASTLVDHGQRGGLGIAGTEAVTVSAGAQKVFWPIPANSVRRPSSTSASCSLETQRITYHQRTLTSIVTVLLPESQIEVMSATPRSPPPRRSGAIALLIVCAMIMIIRAFQRLSPPCTTTEKAAKPRE